MYGLLSLGYLGVWNITISNGRCIIVLKKKKPAKVFPKVVVPFYSSL